MARYTILNMENLMTYVDAIYDKKTETVYVVERVGEDRIYKQFPAEHTFYYNDPAGKYRNLWNNPVSKYSTRSSTTFRKELGSRKHLTTYESDINPTARCLENFYSNRPLPNLHTVFLDIEVDWSLERGFAPPDDPFNLVTAISLYLNWCDKLVTLAIPPKSLSMEEANNIVKEMDNTFLFEKEEDLLLNFLDLLEDADCITGWNTEGFDLPYLVNRVTLILGKEATRKFCLWDRYPRLKIYERYGKEQQTYDLFGRVHLDYLALYKKFTYEERHSYSLDAIAEFELKEKKVQYEGTLDQLYNQDFEKFLVYNRQDTVLVHKLDMRLRFLNLANRVSHNNTVPLAAALGAVQTTDQAITNKAHELGMVVPDKKHQLGDNKPVAGAYVAVPKVGMHDWVASIDIKSLYPSTIRSLNMSPETIIGQLRLSMTNKLIEEKLANGDSFAEAWDGLFGCLEYQAVINKEVGTIITVDWEFDDPEEFSAAEIYNIIFEQNRNWAISANGTIFRYDVEGIIPILLASWYADREKLQETKTDYQNLEYGIELSEDILSLL